MIPLHHHATTARPRARHSSCTAVVLLLAALLATSVILTGCRARSRRTPDDTLVVLSGAVIRDLDPRFALTSNDIKISRLIAPGLTSVDNPSMEAAPALAASIVPVDALTWEVVLREDIRFADGTPVTAEDVVYTYASMLAPDSESLYRKSFSDRFRKVEAVDARRVRFHLNEPLATFLSDIDFGIVSAAAARRGQGRFADGMVMGAGAYRVVRHEPERVVLARNPHYYGDPPPMARVEIRTVRDANARTLMLVGGSADMVQNAIRPDLIDAVAGRARVHAVSGPSAILTYLMMHNEDPILSDVRVRRAIAHAIDRERIVNTKLGGRAVLATGLLPPSHWAYEGHVDRYPYDPARAMALLDEAGYPDPDGPGGAPRLRLTYKTSADQFRLAMSRVIAAQLGDVGIEVDVRSFELGTFLADIKQGNYQLASMQTADITEPDYYYAYFHSSRIPSEKDPHTTNRWRYRSERVDALTEEGRRVADPGARRAIYREVQQVLARDLPILPLWHEDNVALMNVDVSGYRILPNARLSGLLHAKKK